MAPAQNGGKPLPCSPWSCGFVGGGGGSSSPSWFTLVLSLRCLVFACRCGEVIHTGGRVTFGGREMRVYLTRRSCLRSVLRFSECCLASRSLALNVKSDISAFLICSSFSRRRKLLFLSLLSREDAAPS